MYKRILLVIINSIKLNFIQYYLKTYISRPANCEYNKRVTIVLSIDTFDIHIDGLNATFGTVFNTNNTQDSNITNITRTIT